jgi:hypothetical protein
MQSMKARIQNQLGYLGCGIKSPSVHSQLTKKKYYRQQANAVWQFNQQKTDYVFIFLFIKK